MSTLEYTISMLETMPEDKLKEFQKYIQYGQTNGIYTIDEAWEEIDKIWNSFIKK